MGWSVAIISLWAAFLRPSNRRSEREKRMTTEAQLATIGSAKCFTNQLTIRVTPVTHGSSEWGGRSRKKDQSYCWSWDNLRKTAVKRIDCALLVILFCAFSKIYSTITFRRIFFSPLILSSQQSGAFQRDRLSNRVKSVKRWVQTVDTGGRERERGKDFSRRAQCNCINQSSVSEGN